MLVDANSLIGRMNIHRLACVWSVCVLVYKSLLIGISHLSLSSLSALSVNAELPSCDRRLSVCRGHYVIHVVVMSSPPIHA